MVDRIQYPGAGLAGGLPGACGEFIVSDGRRPQPKALLALQADERVQLNLPGGGGYGDPFERDPQTVLNDVVYGYLSMEAAARDYGVVIHYLGRPNQVVRLPEHYALDLLETERRRQARHA